MFIPGYASSTSFIAANCDDNSNRFLFWLANFHDEQEKIQMRGPFLRQSIPSQLPRPFFDIHVKLTYMKYYEEIGTQRRNFLDSMFLMTFDKVFNQDIVLQSREFKSYSQFISEFKTLK